MRTASEVSALDGGRQSAAGRLPQLQGCGSLVGVRTDVIRALADRGVLTPCSGFRNGFARLIATEEIQQFAERYVATPLPAKQWHLNIVFLSRYLTESGIPLLAIPIPAARKGQAIFLTRDVVAQMQVPSRESLSKHVQRRIRAERKKRWADHRLARDSATGKPMRRQLPRKQHSAGRISD